MNRFTVCAVAALVVALSPLAAVEAQAAGKKVAYFAAGPSNPWVAAMSKALMERGTALGFEMTEFDTPYDAALQSQQVDDAIARKFDILAIMPASETAIVPAMARAKQAGIPVVVVNNGVKAGTEDLYAAFVGVDNTQLGTDAGNSLLAAFKEAGRAGGKVALVTGSLAEGAPQQRIAGFTEALKANPEVTIVATEDAQWDTVKSEQIAGQLFARFAPQGGLDAIFAMADNQAAGVVSAAQSAGVELGLGQGQLILVSSNCTREGIDQIKAGQQYSTGTQAPGPIGEKSADVVADVLAGKTVEKTILVPVDTINKGDVDEWAAACTY